MIDINAWLLYYLDAQKFKLSVFGQTNTKLISLSFNPQPNLYSVMARSLE